MPILVQISVAKNRSHFGPLASQKRDLPCLWHRHGLACFCTPCRFYNRCFSRKFSAWPIKLRGSQSFSIWVVFAARLRCFPFCGIEKDAIERCVFSISVKRKELDKMCFGSAQDGENSTGSLWKFGLSLCSPQ